MLTLSWRRSLSCRNHWFLYHRDLRHERVKSNSNFPRNENTSTTNSLISFMIIESEILKVLRNVNIIYAHVYDEISMVMLMLTQNFIKRTPLLTFLKCLRDDLFPKRWKNKYSSSPIERQFGIRDRYHYLQFVIKFSSR